ncbi:hypothetical protein [Burkholderia ubonensis]|uniref:hypothetical protein n=1 Tax=Burkholderia ubonensis TaxID=101571 RepID=UPI000A9142F6|nr:hypothetical protein [Burkholderia ubonensis]
MSDSRVAVTEQLLTQILSNCAPFPELGARLKQQLIAASTAAGQRPFNEKALGFRKFSDYLQRVHGDILSLQRPDGMGDVLVSLKSALPIARGVSAAPSSTPIRLPSQPVIRSEVWQAFANPDVKRKRFFYIPSGQIIHYREGEPPPPQLGAASSNEVIEISPISKETQAGWMREFLDQASVPTQEKSVLEPLINEDYSSTVNATFSRALGPRSDAWRKFRTAQVIEIILRWADDHGIDHSLVHVRPAPVRSVIPGEVGTAAPATNQAASIDANTLSPRERVSKLLDLLSDDDLTRLVIPTLLSTIMIKSRM